MHLFSLKLIPHINTKKYASVLLQVNPTTIVITNLWGQGGGAKSCKGVKIFQLPLLYFTPLVTNIGESLSLTTPAPEIKYIQISEWNHFNFH